MAYKEFIPLQLLPLDRWRYVPLAMTIFVHIFPGVRLKSRVEDIAFHPAADNVGTVRLNLDIINLTVARRCVPYLRVLA